MSLAVGTFDYSALDADTKGKLIYLAGQFNRTMGEHKKSWLELGEAVSEAHGLFAGNGREGQFTKWVESELSVSKKTAYRYKLAWDRFGNKRDTLSHFSTEAIYILAATTAPDKAVSEALKLAAKGARVNKTVADELIEKHTVDDTPNTTTRRASGGASLSAPSPKALPSEGTVNQAEQGSQGTGGAAGVDSEPVGDCPKGGDHDWDCEGICMKCADQGPHSFVGKVEAQRKLVEAFASRVMAAFTDEVPSDPWLDADRLNIAKDQIKSACATVRLAKAHTKPCPKCGGSGCKTCRNCGYLPKSSYEAAGGQ